MVSEKQARERIITICCKTNRGVDLLDAIVTVDGRDWEICALTRQELRNGLLWQWWIAMDA